MQIPPFSAAAQAAGVTSQSTSKDKASSGTDATPPTVATPTDVQVEQSGSSSPDRDAQGQGDGLARGGKRKPAEEETEAPETTPSALLPGEEPGQLDITG